MKSRGAGINFRRHHSRGLSDPESIAGIRCMPLHTLSLIQRLYMSEEGHLFILEQCNQYRMEPPLKTTGNCCSIMRKILLEALAIHMKGKDLSLHDPDKENCSLRRKNYLILKYLPYTPVMSSHGWRFPYHFETEKISV